MAVRTRRRSGTGSRTTTGSGSTTIAAVAGTISGWATVPAQNPVKPGSLVDSSAALGRLLLARRGKQVPAPIQPAGAPPADALRTII